MKKLYGVLMVVILVGLVAAGCKKQTANENKPEPIKIGAALGLTGFASAWAEVERNSLTMAVEDINNSGGINGRPLELVVEDTASDDGKTVSAVQKLLSIDKVKTVQVTWLDTYPAASVLSDQKDVIMFSPSASITAVQTPIYHKNVFSTYLRSDKQAIELANYYSEKKFTKVVLMVQNVNYWTDFANQFKKRADELHLQYTEMDFAPDQSDFRTQLVQVKAMNPDAIFYGFNGDKELLSLYKQRQEIYPNAPFYSTDAIAEFIGKEGYKGKMEGVSYITSSDIKPEFVQKYKNRFGTEPLFAASNTYDGMMIQAEAMRHTDMSTESIRAYVLSHEFDTYTFGKITFDSLNGIVGGSFVMKHVKDDQVIN